MKAVLHRSPALRRKSSCRWMAGALLVLGVFPCGLFAQSAQVVVMSSYPDNVTSRVEEAFEEARPDIDMQLMWRNAQDALAWLEQDGHAPVDVYWTPSPRTFATLKAQGLLQRLTPEQRALPATLGAAQISDEDGYYVATEVAGFGFAINPQGLQARGLATPQDWEELANPTYAGLLALPVPSAVGYAPPMIDIVLQAYGWERGWLLWSEIVGNATLIRRGATLVSDEVASGKTLIGLSIDFFVAATIAGGTDIDFVYPAHGGLNPAHIALLQESANPQAANIFIDFILSREGQQLLAEPDIRKLPIRPDAYAALPAAYHNPFTAAQRGAYDFDTRRSQARTPVLVAAFEQMLITQHTRLQTLWQQLHELEAQGKDMSEARALLGRAPLRAEDADNALLQAQFAALLNEPATRPADAARTAAEHWRTVVEEHLQSAQTLIGSAAE